MKPLSVVLILLSLVGLCGLLFPNDGLLFGGISAISSLAIVCLFLFRSSLIRMVRWTRMHLLASQLLLTAGQVLLIPLSLYGGYNLFKLGIEFSQLGYWIFGAVFVFSFFHIPLFLQKKWLTLPVEFQRHRLAALGICISSVAILGIAGNRLPQQSPDTLVVSVMERIDQSIHAEEDFQAEIQTMEIPSHQVVSSEAPLFHFASQNSAKANVGNGAEDMLSKRMLKKLERKKKRNRRRLRRAIGAGICVLTVLLVILLSGAVCAGICLIVLSESAGGVLLGIAVLPLAIWGIYAAIKMCVRGVENSRKEKS